MSTRRRSGLSPAAERLIEGVFVAPNLKLIRHAGTDRPPKTALRAVTREMEQAADHVGPDGLAGFFAELMALIRAEAAPVLRPFEVTAPKTEIEAMVCAHFDQLDQRLPFASVLLIGGLGFTRPHRLEVTYETMRLSSSSGRARGERKLELMRPLAWHVLENEYGPFLQALVQAACATAGEPFPLRDTVGALVRSAHARGILGARLWLDAGNVRNAAAHRGSWDYDIGRKTVSLHDDRRTPPWREEYDAGAFRDLLLQLVVDSGSLFFVLHRAFERDYLATLAPAFLAFAKTGDKGPMEEALKPIEERIRLTGVELAKLGWKPMSDNLESPTKS